MTLLGVLRDLSVDDVLQGMKFTPLIASQLEELPPRPLRSFASIGKRSIPIG